MKDVRLWGLFFFFGMLALLAPESAWAIPVDSMGAAADQLRGNLLDGKASILDLIAGVAYLAGSLFGVKAAVQLRDNTENPQQTRLSKPLTSMAVSGILLGLPSFTGMFGESMGVLTKGDTLATALGSFGSWGTTPQGSIPQGDSLDKVAEAFAASIPSMNHLISVGAAVAGLFLMLRAVFMLPQLEQGRVEGSKIMWTLLSGVVLWSLLPFVSTTMETLGLQTPTSENLLTEVYKVGNSGSFDKTINSVLTFVSMIGLIAFIRGTLILKAIGENKDGAMGRALTHILGGAAAMNIKWTVAVLATSIGSKSAICDIATAGVLCAF